MSLVSTVFHFLAPAPAPASASAPISVHGALTEGGPAPLLMETSGLSPSHSVCDGFRDQVDFGVNQAINPAVSDGNGFFPKPYFSTSFFIPQTLDLFPVRLTYVSSILESIQVKRKDGFVGFQDFSMVSSGVLKFTPAQDESDLDLLALYPVVPDHLKTMHLSSKLSWLNQMVSEYSSVVEFKEKMDSTVSKTFPKSEPSLKTKLVFDLVTLNFIKSVILDAVKYVSDSLYDTLSGIENIREVTAADVQNFMEPLHLEILEVNGIFKKIMKIFLKVNDFETEELHSLNHVIHDFNNTMTTIVLYCSIALIEIKDTPTINLEELQDQKHLDKIIGRSTKFNSALWGHGRVKANLEMSSSLNGLLIPDTKQARLFEDIMNNLISNAIKYRNPKLDPEECFVNVRVRLSGGGIKIEVEDNGRGMNVEELQTYGAYSWRSPAVIQEGVEGHGVGVHSTFKAIESLSGSTVDVTSLPGQGTRVTFILPFGMFEQQ